MDNKPHITMNLYSVYDIKAGQFAKPWMAGRHDEALRAFANASRDEKSGFNANPEDYQLFHIGSLDLSFGLLEAVQPSPVYLATASDYKN